ncbi:hypothetical protein ACI796_02440 [Geodermatophilus sp. SYSU D00525]
MSDAGTTAWGPLPPARILSGDEPIDGAGARLRDFWAWAYSDLRTNTVRPMLAEYLVARAVGADLRPRVEWDPYDVLTPDGLRLEVKSGAYLQAWEQSKLSSITFGGLRARLWTDGGPVGEPTYNADGYVFAVLTTTEHALYDALDLGQWSFWVLPRSVVEATGQSSVGLARVEALAGPPVGYAELAGRIREVVVPTA